MLDPRDIEMHKFTTTRLTAGYDQEEVDIYLDRCGETIAALNRQIDDLLLRLDAERKAREEGGNSISGIERLLTVAQKAADETEAEANHRAALVLSEAHDKAANIIANAHTQVDDMVSDAKKEQKRIVSEAQSKADGVLADSLRQKDKLAGEVDRLSGIHGELLRRLRAALDVISEGTSSQASKEG